MRSLRVELPYLPPPEFSANRSRGAAWQRQWRVSRGRRGAIEEIILLVKEQGWQGPPMERARVSVHFQLPDRRRRDPGALQERMKPWFDGLVEAEVLADDNLDVIGWPIYSHDVVPRQPRTVITVEADHDLGRTDPTGRSVTRVYPR